MYNWDDNRAKEVIALSVSSLASKVESYVEELCVKIASRHVGSLGNQRATEFFRQRVASFGFETESPEFGCIDWEHGDVTLQVGSAAFGAFVSPYSLACDVVAPLVCASTVEELENAPITGNIVLLRSELAQERLMPKNLPFYNPDEHQRTIGLLEEASPAAIVRATSRSRGMADGSYPFPMSEDGDFDILASDTSFHFCEALSSLGFAAYGSRGPQHSSPGSLCRRGSSVTCGGGLVPGALNAKSA